VPIDGRSRASTFPPECVGHGGCGVTLTVFCSVLCGLHGRLSTTALFSRDTCKISYADIAFIQWQQVVSKLLDKDRFNPDEFPHVKEWLGKLTSRKAIAKVLATAFEGH
jgi:hypothetical protein